MKYLAYYDIDENRTDDRSFVLSARNKVDYIISVISEKTDVQIISASGVRGKSTAKGKTINISDKVELRLFTSIGRKNRVISLISTLYMKLQLFVYLLLNTKPGETIVVYHSLGYCSLVSLVKRMKKIRLILELEELYGDVTCRKRDKARELRLAKQADGFIFPTQLLDDAVNTKGKPSVIIHGTYSVEADRQCNVFAAEDSDRSRNVIHCVYAGTFDPRKGGFEAASAAEYLPANYHIHILGFGSEREIENMKEHVAQTAKRSAARVTFDGLLSGEDYIRFIQSCDIGLSTQEPKASFNATSFPSKILSYLSNGLQVVSIRIPAIENSAVGKKLNFYDEQSPEEIARAILAVNNNNPDGRETIDILDKKFRTEVFRLLDLRVE